MQLSFLLVWLYYCYSGICTGRLLLIWTWVAVDRCKDTPCHGACLCVARVCATWRNSFSRCPPQCSRALDTLGTLNSATRRVPRQFFWGQEWGKRNHCGDYFATTFITQGVSISSAMGRVVAHGRQKANTLCRGITAGKNNKPLWQHRVNLQHGKVSPDTYLVCLFYFCCIRIYIYMYIYIYTYI